MESNKPIQVFKAGAVKASIFQNEGINNQSPLYRVVLDRSYKDAQGRWQSTNGFSVLTDVPKALLVLSKAYEYIALKPPVTPNSVQEEYVK